MKKHWKKVVAAAGTLLLLLALRPSAMGVQTMYIMSANDKVLEDSQDTMPFVSGGTVYVPYTLFIEEFNKGVAVTDIAKMLGVSATTIWRRIEELQVKRTMEIEKRIDKKRCIEMLRNGCTNEEIAREFECSVTTIKRFLKKRNLRGYRKKKVTKAQIPIYRAVGTTHWCGSTSTTARQTKIFRIQLPPQP